jgi:hypothetical protein
MDAVKIRMNSINGDVILDRFYDRPLNIITARKFFQALENDRVMSDNKITLRLNGFFHHIFCTVQRN